MKPPKITLHLRRTSNNACRISLWLSALTQLLPGVDLSTLTVRNVSHADQGSIPNNFTGKIPLLTFDDVASEDKNAIGSISESQIILQYLEDVYGGSNKPQPPLRSSSFMPPTPILVARMNQIIRTSDLYISSPSSHSLHPRNLHTQACLYIPPPNPSSKRGVPIDLRSSLLSDLFDALILVETLLPSSSSPTEYALGSLYPHLTLADFTLYPTLAYAVHYLSLVYSYDVTSAPPCPPSTTRGYLWARLPRLQQLYDLYENSLRDHGVGQMIESLKCDRIRENVCLIKDDLRRSGNGYTWMY